MAAVSRCSMGALHGDTQRARTAPVGLMLTLAPRSSSSRTTSRRPFLAAKCSGAERSCALGRQECRTSKARGAQPRAVEHLLPLRFRPRGNAH